MNYELKTTYVDFKTLSDVIGKEGVKKTACVYFHGKSHFEYDGTQNYLVFQPVCRCF